MQRAFTSAMLLQMYSFSFRWGMGLELEYQGLEYLGEQPVFVCGGVARALLARPGWQLSRSLFSLAAGPQPAGPRQL
jgi:hypothetical protein